MSSSGTSAADDADHTAAAERRLIADAGIVNNEYCKLAYYLYCVLTCCGIDVVAHELLECRHSETSANIDTNQDTLLLLATGKQFNLSSMSYKTVFLANDESVNVEGVNAAGSILSVPDGLSNRFVPVAEVLEAQVMMDPMLLGGMIPVQPTHIMVCTTQWIRTFYADPIRRIQQSKKDGAAASGPSSSSSLSIISDEEIRAMFVRTTASEIEADAMDMTSRFQKMIQDAKAKKEASAAAGGGGGTFQSFSGVGVSLGTTTSSSTTGSSTNADQEHGHFDLNTIPDPPPVDPTAPTTSIAVRLLDGKRVVVKVNLTNTILDIAGHIRDKIAWTTTTTTDAHQQNDQTAYYHFTAGFPPRPILHNLATTTITDAGLKGAQISLQKTSTTSSSSLDQT